MNIRESSFANIFQFLFFFFGFEIPFMFRKIDYNYSFFKRCINALNNHLIYSVVRYSVTVFIHGYRTKDFLSILKLVIIFFFVYFYALLALLDSS